MKLSQPIKIGNVEVKNRIVMAPMTTHFAENGYVTDRMIDYYETRAQGGVGLLTVEDGIIDFPIGNNTDNPLSIDDDKYIPMFKKLADAIKKHGAISVLQLSHAGRRAGRLSHRTGCLEMTRGRLPVAPSSLAHPAPGHVVPRSLSIEEIEEIIEKFASGAKRAVEAGFEMVGVHCAHMYLCGQFLSPLSNIRKDSYGGDLKNRMRFVLEVIRKIKNEIGEDIPIVCRVNGQESVGGNSISELQEIAYRLEGAGVHAIHVSVGFGSILWEEDFVPAEAPIGMPEGCIVHLAENIKEAVSIPVIAVNKIRHVDYAEKILQENKADMIALGRPLLADPEWPLKALSHRAEDIRPCVSCCQGCVRGIETGEPITCLINPRVGKENEMKAAPVSEEDLKKVLIIGGGPAGLQTAITAAEKGHAVTIWEKENKLGGKIKLAAKPPRKKELHELIDYFRMSIKKLKINVVVNMEADAKAIKGFGADVVVIAIGSQLAIPSIEGVDSINVKTADEILLEDKGVGEKAIIIGGGLVGLETAEFLSEKGKEITVLEMMEELAPTMPFLTKIPLLINLEKKGVVILKGASVRRILPDCVEIVHKGVKKIIKASSIILSTGEQADNRLEKELKDVMQNVYSCGSCHLPGDILTAVHEGLKVGLQI